MATRAVMIARDQVTAVCRTERKLVNRKAPEQIGGFFFSGAIRCLRQLGCARHQTCRPWPRHPPERVFMASKISGPMARDHTSHAPSKTRAVRAAAAHPPLQAHPPGTANRQVR